MGSEIIRNDWIVYTYPNTTSFSKRGGLKERSRALKEINNFLNQDIFKIVEIPADFIKNRSEEKKTGLNVCSMLDPDSVKKIYTKSSSATNVQYILHTEPVFSRKGQKKSCTSHLKWYDSNWLKNFLKHLFNIVDFFKYPPYAIEIHPGMSKKGKNNIKTFSQAIDTLHNEYFDKYGISPLIFIENRTNQHIQDGTGIKEFWNYFKDEYAHLTNETGIILDIQQLYTSTKNYDFKLEFKKIPEESLMGVHIHERHRKPLCKHIPKEIWQFVADNHHWSGKENRSFHVLPEVHHSGDVLYTYIFCKDFLRI